jgi:hypothetical protein
MEALLSNKCPKLFPEFIFTLSAFYMLYQWQAEVSIQLP